MLSPVSNDIRISVLFIFALLSYSIQPVSTNEEISARMEQNRNYYGSTSSVGWVANLYGMCANGTSGYAQNLGEDPLFNADGRLVMGSLTKSMTVVLLSILLSQNKIFGQSPVESNTIGAFG